SLAFKIKFVCYPALTCWANYLSSLRDSARREIFFVPTISGAICMKRPRRPRCRIEIQQINWNSPLADLIDLPFQRQFIDRRQRQREKQTYSAIKDGESFAKGSIHV